MPRRLAVRAALLAAAVAPLAAAPVRAQTGPSSRTTTAPAAGAERARVERLLRGTPLIDGHNDLPWAIRGDSAARGDVARYDLRTRTPGHTDFDRLRRGMVGAQFWSVYIPGEPRAPAYARTGEVSSTPGYARVQLEQIDVARRVIERYPDRLGLALRADDVPRHFRAGRIASFLGMEGGHAIENSLGALRTYYDLGVRYMTLTHNVTLDWADAAGDAPRHGGLTRFGEQVVREMNRLGMLVDLSHVSPGTMSDALTVSRAPVIFSHSSARAVTDHPRNVPDSILTRVRENGGLVMVTFVSGFVTRDPRTTGAAGAAANDSLDAIQRRFASDSAGLRAAVAQWSAAHPAPRATMDDVIAHLEHVRRVAGPDHVGLGGDYDGTTGLPEGLEDVSKYPDLFVALARRGWSDADLRKLAGENLLRVLRAAERVSAEMQRGGNAPASR
jgi:membrane dipeptidase